VEGLALQITVVSVLGVALSLMLLTVVVRLLELFRRRRVERLLPTCRSEVLGFVVDGVPPRGSSRAERRLTVDLLLSHLSLLRGSEAETITGYLERTGYIDEQLRGLHARRARTRVLAADALGRARSPRAIPALAEAVLDPVEDVRLVAARSLAVIGTEPAARALATALSRPSRLAPRLAPAMVADDLVFVGRPAVPALLQIARCGHAETAATAARVLGEIRDPAATDVLVGLMRGAQTIDVRAQAASALGKIGGGRSTYALMRALDDDAWEVRAQAAKALGRIGDRRAVPALESAMPDASWWVRVDCGEALAALGEAGLEALQRLTRSSDRYAAEQAESALAAAMRRRPRPVQPVAPAPSREVEHTRTPQSAQVAS